MVMNRAMASQPLVELVEHPFGKGSLTTNGVQYGAVTAGAGSAAYVAVPGAATIYRPAGTRIAEVEFGLTEAVLSSNSVETMMWKFQASDNNTDWEDLIAGQTAVSGAAVSTTYTDVTALGRFAPTGNFAGTANPFYVRGAVKAAAAATGTVSGKIKSSSYVVVKYKGW